MSNPETEFMIDLETLGKSPDAAVIAIGAVAFTQKGRQIVSRFSARVDLEDAIKHGGKVDASTVLWWLRQPKGAQQENFGEHYGYSSVHRALGDFSDWLTRNSDCDRPSVWGNGAASDNVWLRRMYERADQTPPWDFRDDRCYRTLKNLPHSCGFHRVGPKHVAVYDAESQALHLMAIRSQLELEP